MQEIQIENNISDRFESPNGRLSGFSVHLVRKKDETKVKYRRSFPFILFYVFPIIPLVFAASYLNFDLSKVGGIYTFLIAYGIIISFFYSLLNLPLAIKHKMQKTLPTTIVFPRVTVIVPAYNEEAGIARTIEALIETDYPSKEIIVVDDGSKDQTFNIASSYVKKAPPGRLTVIRKENGGKGSALNYALLFAKGEIIVVVDADSIVAKNTLKELVTQLQDPTVVAISGNPKVLNRNNFWTQVQVLEYIVGISLFKRAYALFGVVMVVPGSLGAFRKEALIQNGGYDNDTLTEDFDITVKMLKTGKKVVLSSDSIAYTEIPATFKDLYKQRIRWQSGNLQTLIKHKDIMVDSKYGMLYKYGYPLILLTMLTLPFLGMIVTGFVIVVLFQGTWWFLISSFIVFSGFQFLLSAIAILLDKEDWKVAIYSPLLVLGYKQILDYFTIKSTLDVLFRKKMVWKPSARYGMVSSDIPSGK